MSSFNDMLSSFVEEAGKEKKKRKKRKGKHDGGGLDAGGAGGKKREKMGRGGDPGPKGVDTAAAAAGASIGGGGEAKVNFLCVGMQKAGTSWIYKMLEAHPGVALSMEKEVHYWDMHKEKGKDDGWYDAQFPQGVEGKVVGEVTPDYLSMWMNR